MRSHAAVDMADSVCRPKRGFVCSDFTESSAITEDFPMELKRSPNCATTNKNSESTYSWHRRLLGFCFCFEAGSLAPCAGTQFAVWLRKTLN